MLSAADRGVSVGGGGAGDDCAEAVWLNFERPIDWSTLIKFKLDDDIIGVDVADESLEWSLLFLSTVAGESSGWLLDRV